MIYILCFPGRLVISLDLVSGEWDWHAYLKKCVAVHNLVGNWHCLKKKDTSNHPVSYHWHSTPLRFSSSIPSSAFSIKSFCLGVFGVLSNT